MHLESWGAIGDKAFLNKHFQPTLYSVYITSSKSFPILYAKHFPSSFTAVNCWDSSSTKLISIHHDIAQHAACRGGGGGGGTRAPGSLAYEPFRCMHVLTRQIKVQHNISHSSLPASFTIRQYGWNILGPLSNEIFLGTTPSNDQPKFLLNLQV